MRKRLKRYPVVVTTRVGDSEGSKLDKLADELKVDRADVLREAVNDLLSKYDNEGFFATA